MNSDFKNYVYARTDEALKNKRYKEAQSKFVEALMEENIKKIDEVSGEAELIATELCYMQGFNDAMQMMLQCGCHYDNKTTGNNVFRMFIDSFQATKEKEEA